MVAALPGPIRFIGILYIRVIYIPKRRTASEFLLTGQLKKVLPENLVEKYQERLQDESLKMVDLPNLVRYVTFTFTFASLIITQSATRLLTTGYSRLDSNAEKTLGTERAIMEKEITQ